MFCTIFNFQTRSSTDTGCLTSSHICSAHFLVMISSSGVLSRLYLLPVKRDYHCTRLRFPPEFSYCMESRSFPSYGSFHSPDLHRCYSYHVPRPHEHIAVPMYNLSPVPASFPHLLSRSDVSLLFLYTATVVSAILL